MDHVSSTFMSIKDLPVELWHNIRRAEKAGKYKSQAQFAASNLLVAQRSSFYQSGVKENIEKNNQRQVVVPKHRKWARQLLERWPRGQHQV